MIMLNRTSGQTERQYNNCISLGWFCGTAMSLEKLGLRSRSGPFDWYFSDYRGVLKQIETGFSDFMTRDNLQIIEGKEKEFRDLKYGFYCNHDVKEDFDSEYASIYERYMRRAKQFMNDILSPTVFFRTIRDTEEIKLINDNWDYADKLLKGYNFKNRIVYVKRRGLDGLTNKVEAYDLSFPEYIGNIYEMRHLFDSSKALLDLCAGLISTDKMHENIKFDKQKNAWRATAAYVNKCIEENIDGVDQAILTALSAKEEDGIYLWGAGNYGLPLARYLSERGVVIKGIIDNAYLLRKSDEFSVISFDDVEDGSRIFITVANEEIKKEIFDQIRQHHTYTKALGYADIYELLCAKKGVERVEQCAEGLKE